MPRITITADPSDREGETVVLQERIVPSHIEDGHSADQLIERVGWAVLDATEIEARDIRSPEQG